MKRAVGRIMSHVMPIKLASAPLSLAHWIRGTRASNEKLIDKSDLIDAAKGRRRAAAIPYQG